MASSPGAPNVHSCDLPAWLGMVLDLLSTPGIVFSLLGTCLLRGFAPCSSRGTWRIKPRLAPESPDGAASHSRPSPRKENLFLAKRFQLQTHLMIQGCFAVIRRLCASEETCKGDEPSRVSLSVLRLLARSD